MTPITSIRITKTVTSGRTLFCVAIYVTSKTVCSGTIIGSIYQTKTTTIISTKWISRRCEPTYPKAAFRTRMITCSPVLNLHRPTIETIVDTLARSAVLCRIRSTNSRNIFVVTIAWTMLRISLVKFVIRYVVTLLPLNKLLSHNSCARR